jgi:hypothetical protein
MEANDVTVLVTPIEDAKPPMGFLDEAQKLAYEADMECLRRKLAKRKRATPAPMTMVGELRRDA